MRKSNKTSESSQPLNITFNTISTDTHFKTNNMKTLLLLMLYLTSINGLNRYRRSCSTDLQTAFASLIKKQHLIISVPEEEQTMHVQQLPSIYNQPRNQQAFFENLKHETFLHKHRHSPTFLLKPSYQSPEDRCFSLFQRNRDLKGPSMLSQQHEYPHAILHFFLDYGTLDQIKSIPNEEQTTNLHLIFPRDADVFLFIFYVVTSFYERHKSISTENKKLKFFHLLLTICFLLPITFVTDSTSRSLKPSCRKTSTKLSVKTSSTLTSTSPSR